LFLFSIKPYSLCYHRIASTTPNVERHLKSYNQDALIELPCPLPERMLAMELVQSTLLRAPFRRVVEVISSRRSERRHGASWLEEREENGRDGDFPVAAAARAAIYDGDVE